MSKFTSYSIAIPLPDSFLLDFDRTLKSIEAVFPQAQTVSPSTPHITLFYLLDTAEEAFNKVSRVIEMHKTNLKGIKLKIQNFGYFRGDNPKVIFLDVQYPESVKEFSSKLCMDLNQYSARDNNFTFHPHLTVSTLKTDQAKESFKQIKEELVQVLKNVKWEFTLSEVALYGANSNEIPEFQQRLITYKL